MLKFVKNTVNESLACGFHLLHEQSIYAMWATMEVQMDRAEKITPIKSGKFHVLLYNAQHAATESSAAGEFKY